MIDNISNIKEAAYLGIIDPVDAIRAIIAFKRNRPEIFEELRRKYAEIWKYQ